MDKSRFEIIATYIVLAVCGIIGSIPSYDMQNIAIVLTLIILVALYLARSREKEDSLPHHHLTFMIRTVWIYSFIFVLALCAATATIYEIGNISTLTSMNESVMQGVIPGAAEMEGTVVQFMADNQAILISWLSLPLFYMLWRVTRGASRAYRNYRLQNIYSWF